MSKTKKDIIGGHYACTCYEIYKSRKMIDPSCVLHDAGPEIELIMDEYALQEMGKFAEWLQENRWFHFESGKWHYTFEHGTAMGKKTYEKNYIKTTEQLIQLYLNRDK